MARWLRLGFAGTVSVGPFLDDTDGKTAETALGLVQADVRLSSNGAAFAQKNSATAPTHDENGYYLVTLNATDTGTLGRLRLAVSKSGALPVWEDFMIVPTVVYDALVAGSDNLDVAVTEGIPISGW